MLREMIVIYHSKANKLFLFSFISFNVNEIQIKVSHLATNVFTN